MDSFLKCVFVRARKHTSVHDVHPHSNNVYFMKVYEFHVPFLLKGFQISDKNILLMFF